MTGTIVVVDDSLTVRMDLASTFEEAGFRAVPCASAAEARAALAREPADVVILDVILPDGDGVELLRELRARERGGDLVILMLSTEAEVKDRVRGMRTGADEYVGKPYDGAYVVGRVRELLRERRGEVTAARQRVLVIDDSATSRAVLEEALLGAGYEVSTAVSGEDGLRVAAAERPNAIIVDGMLPGMDGPAVIRKVRLDAALRGVACVLFTGSEREGAELDALDAGADAFVRKEEDSAVILAKVATALRVASAPVEASSLLAPKKVLVVDDEEATLDRIRAALRMEGYDVIVARSGEEAIELLAVQPVDCALLDHDMPGMGGEEACRRIKSAPVVRDVPLLLLTSEGSSDAMLRCLGAGADDSVPKSVDNDVLRARVRAQLRRKQVEDETRRVRERILKAELASAEARAARELAETRAVLVAELESKNAELEAFSYSVSHDLRAPLRSIDGFSKALLEDYGESLDGSAKDYLHRVCASAKRMNELIEDLLALSRVSRADLARTPVDVSGVAEEVAAELARREPARKVAVVVEPGMRADADARLLTAVFENLLGNAWKFTAKTESARVEVGSHTRDGSKTFVIHDNGAGFDMAYAGRLFAPFRRLHREVDYPGTGIGLATVRRIVERHGGKVWAEGEPGRGATFSFTLAPSRPLEPRP